METSGPKLPKCHCSEDPCMWPSWVNLCSHTRRQLDLKICTFLISLNTDQLLCRKGDAMETPITDTPPDLLFAVTFKFCPFYRFNMVVYVVWLSIFLSFSLLDLAAYCLLTPSILDFLPFSMCSNFFICF